MQFLLDIPLGLRLVGVALLGAIIASLANAAAYQFAWVRRPRSPWQTPPEGVLPRGWLDYLPVVGWWRLRREASHHGAGHWIRPLAVEIFFPLFLAWLYWWEVEAGGLLSLQAKSGSMGIQGGLAVLDLRGIAFDLHLMFFAHAVLASFMLVASLIDIDDRIIPDIVTVPGTLIGLVLATLVPTILLPQITATGHLPIAGQGLVDRGANPAIGFLGNQLFFEPVHAAASNPWPAVLAPAPNLASLVIGWSCFWLWCFAFVRRRWRKGIGMVRAARFFAARVGRDWWTTPLREITALGTIAVAGVWWWGGPHWVGLLTSLIGLVGAGGAIWLIRILASRAMQEEAMGFGDVLLMMMVGTFVGWQAGVVIFFVAPFVAIVFAVLQLILLRQRHLPYGPFLCVGTLLVIVRWDPIWVAAEPLFSLPWLVPAVLVVCLVACGLLLMVIRTVKLWLLGGR